VERVGPQVCLGSPGQNSGISNTYFLIGRDLSLPPSLVEKTHKMNRRLDGAFQGQEPFTGTSPLGVFTFLTIFRRACDAAGLMHGCDSTLLVRPRHGALFQSRGGQPIRETGRSGSNTIPTNVKPVQGAYAHVPHISSLSGGDPLVITPSLTNHNRDLETSLGLVNRRAGPQFRA